MGNEGTCMRYSGTYVVVSVKSELFTVMVSGTVHLRVILENKSPPSLTGLILVRAF